MTESVSSSPSHKIVSWYGAPAEIAVEDELWHLVRVAGVPLNHPPVVNLILRRGLPRRERLYLSFLHEFGHLQTLPIAIGHLLLLFFRGNWRAAQPRHTIASLVKVFIAHQAIWELASETYVVARAGRSYQKIYRHFPNVAGQTIFWGAMGALASILTLQLLNSRTPGKGDRPARSAERKAGHLGRTDTAT